MKIRIILLVAVFTLALGCNKENITTIEKDQDVNTTLKAGWTEYSGESHPYGIPELGEMTFLPNGDVKLTGFIGYWYEIAVDENGDPLPVLSGESTYYETAKYNVDDPKLHIWGTVDVIPEEGGGVWKGHYNGYAYFMGDPPYDFYTSHIESDGFIIRFTGHGGDIQGMVVRATYRIDTQNVGFFWEFDGEYK